MRSFLRLLMPFAFAGLFAATALADEWRVQQASGEVHVVRAGAQPVALSSGTALNAGDEVITGSGARALLRRGQETLIVSPNSAVGIPQARSQSGPTILQRAGSILLEVDKRDDKRFEVETPYLAAVVKGTQFRVTVGSADARVEVLQGAVEVTAFKSGQVALVNPGQSAAVSVQGAGELSLSGAGQFEPIRQGPPRAPSVQPAPAPAERHAANTIRVPDASAPSSVSPVRRQEPQRSPLSEWFGTGSSSARSDVGMMVAFPVVVGVAVAAAVAAKRRRRKPRK
jgi:hypothetical protein